ncbi:hypothetical protein KI387_030826, partial [Taxus chinensis]
MSPRRQYKQATSHRYVVLVGGSSRIPKVQKLLTHFFEGKELSKSINLDEVVAYGTTLVAVEIRKYQYQASRFQFQPSFYMQPMGFTMGKPHLSLPQSMNTTMLKYYASFYLGKKHSTPLEQFVEPQSLDITNICDLKEVNCLSLGIAFDANTEMEVVVPRNTPLPTQMEIYVSTSYDNQKKVHFRIYEGMRPLTADNNFTGEFVLRRIPPSKRGVPQIIVCFRVDAYGSLTAFSRHVGSGITRSGSLIVDEGGRYDSEE